MAEKKTMSKTPVKKVAVKKPARTATQSVSGGVAAKKVVAKKVAAKKVAVKKVPVTKGEVSAPAPAKKSVAAPAAKSAPKVAPATRYIYAVGRRKTASVQVRLFVDSKEETVINGRTLEKYFGHASLVANVLAPLKNAGYEERGAVSLLARGGGMTGQSDASKLAIARALVKHDPLLRPALKAAGFLTRDARKVERKKPGLKKARKSPQWAKR
jgi:small subunit ribosomal protein S9